MRQDDIIEAVLGFIDRRDESDEAFGRLALTIFAYQFANNLPYRRFCSARGRTPLTVRAWRDIPAVPISAFKDATLSCCPPEQALHVFMTSGTTRGVRGRSYHPNLRVWERSMLGHFRPRFMRGLEQIRMGILFPDEAALPNSSLAHYLALARRECGAPESRGFISETGLDLAALLETLAEAEAGSEPFALLGASYSFVPVLDALEASGRRFRLPDGSRILDTGGFKGQSRELQADEFYEGLSQAFGVPRSACVNMYGMTELSSQLYDEGNAVSPAVKSGPHWVRSRVVDPLTGLDLPPGETGVILHHDLAHFNCAAAILTEDAGVIVPGGFKLLGRADGADSRGCSVAVEEFLKAAQG